MSQAHRLIASLLALLLAGCSAKMSTTSRRAPQPADAKTLQALRHAYQRADADARVGVVIAMRSLNSLVAVGEVRPKDFRVDQVVTFIDSNQRVLTTGRVVRLLEDSVHAHYDNPPVGGRAPRVGDLMLKLPPGARTL
jgi:hypothetical protein